MCEPLLRILLVIGGHAGGHEMPRIEPGPVTSPHRLCRKAEQIAQKLDIYVLLLNYTAGLSKGKRGTDGI